MTHVSSRQKGVVPKAIFDENGVLFGLRNMGGKGYLCLGKMGWGPKSVMSTINSSLNSKMKNPFSTFNVTGVYFSPQTIIFVHAFFESTKFEEKNTVLQLEGYNFHFTYCLTTKTFLMFHQHFFPAQL